MLVRKRDIDVEKLGDPEAAHWGSSVSRKVALVAAPASLQITKYIQGKWSDGQFGQTSELGLQAAHNGRELAFRLEWECTPRSDAALDNDQFADAAALLFPLSESAPLIMGAEGAPVNIWHWRADRPKAARNNVAAGIGTSRLTNTGPAITTRAVHQHGRWFLVLRRALAVNPPAPEAVQFEPGRNHKVALAIWKGSNAERAGLKAYSPEWVELELEA